MRETQRPIILIGFVWEPEFKTLGRTFHIVNRFGIYIFWPLSFSFDNKILY